MTYYGACEFCGQEVSTRDGRTPVRGVRGWEPIREGGGANHVIGREEIPNAIAHKTCAVDEYARRRRGLRGQEALL